MSGTAALRLIVCLGAACAPVSGEPNAAQTVTAGADFILAPGQTARVAPPADGFVRLLRVVEDGRCPREVSCAASGPVTVEAELGAGKQPARRERLSILDRDVGEPRFPGLHSCTGVGGAVLRLRDVQPWPVGRKPIAPDRYRATFILGPSCAPAGDARPIKTGGQPP